MEDELVSAVGAHAQSGKTSFNNFYVAMLWCVHLTEQCTLLTFSVADESGGSGFFSKRKGLSGPGPGPGPGPGSSAVTRACCL